MDYDRIIKRSRKTAILDVENSGHDIVKMSYGKPDIQKIIPHRDPFLLVDKLTYLDLSEGEETIIGERYISPDDPVFKGHFPDFPVYPGSLQLEMSGQLGLCLSHFVLGNTTKITDDATPSPVRATKVLGAQFLEPVLPGQTVTMISRKLEFDGYFGTVLSQVIAEGKITCVSIAEVIFLTDD